MKPQEKLMFQKFNNKKKYASLSLKSKKYAAPIHNLISGKMMNWNRLPMNWNRSYR